MWLGGGEGAVPLFSGIRWHRRPPRVGRRAGSRGTGGFYKSRYPIRDTSVAGHILLPKRVLPTLHGGSPQGDSRETQAQALMPQPGATGEAVRGGHQ